MRVLVACEFSGHVRDAFTSLGHYALSCDLRPTASPGEHYQGDVFDVINDGWDMMIAFPPCTYLSRAGARWWSDPQRQQHMFQAVTFVKRIANAPIPRIAIENPVGKLNAHWRYPDQVIQPWQFGHGEQKATCLWLKNLPLLQPTKIVSGREQRIVNMPWSKDRQMLRSITYPGIASAMAQQWGTYHIPVQQPIFTEYVRYA